MKAMAMKTSGWTTAMLLAGWLFGPAAEGAQLGKPASAEGRDARAEGKAGRGEVKDVGPTGKAEGHGQGAGAASKVGAKPESKGESRVSVPDAKININTASTSELESLAGIGAKTAQKIVDYRQAHGPFKTVEDLTKVDGVGKGILEKNAGRIVLR